MKISSTICMMLSRPEVRQRCGTSCVGGLSSFSQIVSVLCLSLSEGKTNLFIIYKPIPALFLTIFVLVLCTISFEISSQHQLPQLCVYFASNKLASLEDVQACKLETMTETWRMSQIWPCVKRCAKKTLCKKTLGQKTDNWNRLLCWFHNLHSETLLWVPQSPSFFPVREMWMHKQIPNESDSIRINWCQNNCPL